MSPVGSAVCPGDPASSDARMLSLDGEWFGHRIVSFGRMLWVEAAAQPIKGGMSGSPIILPDCGVVGVLCTGNRWTQSDAVRSIAGMAGACRLLNKMRREARL